MGGMEFVALKNSMVARGSEVDIGGTVQFCSAVESADVRQRVE